jgi:nucleotide-binding universal stress UspA family protein
MLESRHIVIGVDFSAAGMAALREGIRLVRIGVGEATALHVLESPNLEMHEGYAPHLVDLRAELRAQAEAKWRELSADLGPITGLKFLSPVGSAASTLLEYASPLTNTILVLGINSSDPFIPGAGIVASQCVRYAEGPVLLVAPRFVGPYRHILLATDFSATAAVACRWADEAARHDGAKLTVLHVRTPRELGMPAAEHRLEAFVKDHAPLVGSSARRVVKDGAQRGRTIADFASDEQVDLIVMGRRGHSPIRHLLVGSTAERVLKKIACNVLLLSPSAG